MKIIVFMMSLLFVIPLFCAEKQSQSLVRNLTILINSSIPTTYTFKDPIFHEFFTAMCQQASPIIVHINTFVAYVRISNLFSEKTSEKEKKLWGMLNLEKFDVYKQQQSNFMLIIPHVYKDRLAKQFPEVSEVDRLGFDIEDATSFIKVNGIDIKSMKLVTQKTPVGADEIIVFFVRDNVKSPNGVWNVYLAGHGLLPKQAEKATPLFAHKQLSEMINLAASPRTAGLSVDGLRELISYFKIFNTNFLFYKSCYAGGYNLLMPYAMNLFVEQLVSEQEAEKIWPQLPKEKRAAKIPHLKSSMKVSPNFTIAVGSSFDAPVSGVENWIDRCNAAQGHLNFNAFFDLLTEYTQHELKIKKSVPTPIPFSDIELRKILSKVIEDIESEKDPLGLWSMPQVRFPNIGQFVPFPLDPQKVFVLSNVLVKGAQLEKKPVVIPSSPVPDAVIMPVSEIPVTIKIITQRMPAFISMLPGISVNILDEINAEKVMFTDFVRAFGLLDVEFLKYFFIKKVVVSKDKNGPLLKKDPLMLTNVLMAVTNGNVRMFYTIENSVYFTAAYVSGDKKEQTQIKSFVLQNSPITTFLPIVPGSDAHMPDYLSVYQQKAAEVNQAFYDWNDKNIGKYILPQTKDQDFWESLGQMSSEQRIKSQTIERKAEQRRAELTTKK